MNLIVHTLSSHTSMVMLIMHILKVSLTILEIRVKQGWAPVITVTSFIGTYIIVLSGIWITTLWSNFVVRNITAIRMYQVSSSLMNKFARVIYPPWWVETYIMSCLLAQKVFESEWILIVGASRGLGAAIHKTWRWLTTDTILNNLGVIPQESRIMLSLEGWLINWWGGLFQLRVRLCLVG